MELKDRILIVEDEKSLANYIKTIVESNDYDSLVAENAQQAINMMAAREPNLMLLDLGLPDIDGMKLLEQVRHWSHIPIIVVSARQFEQDKVKALELGADDYITKPFGASELVARIKVALRHGHANSDDRYAANTGKLQIRDLIIDFDKRNVSIFGNDIHLTQNEYKIICLLARNAGKVITYSTLMKEIWGPYSGDNNQILRVNMTNIRHKLEKDPAQPEYIKTELGVGYIMPDE